MSTKKLRFPMLKKWLLLFTSHSLCALTTLTVTESTDNDAGGFGNVGELRYWLNTMNVDLNAGPDDYAILFSPAAMTIQLNGILPIINNSSNPVNITIGNPGSTAPVIIDGNSGTYSGFFLPTGTVTIQNMNFQNLTAKGGNGGDGISGGGGGMGAGGAIYAPATFLNGTTPSITLMNVTINTCSAVGGNGGNYIGGSSTGDEGGGGGGGFSGNGGSITTTGATGGGGGGGFGGDGGNVVTSTPSGGGGGGGGGFGSRATIGTPTNLGTGGQSDGAGLDGSAYGLNTTAGSGAGTYPGGSNLGGGGGGDAQTGGDTPGGGGGGSSGSSGTVPQGSTPPGGSASPSGGSGADGGGGGGGGVVATGISNSIDGQAGNGFYGGGGGGGAGTGASDDGYSVQGGVGGVGGGGGGGGVDISGSTSASGGDSQGGGGGGGGGPSSSGSAPSGGTDTGSLGGGPGGNGDTTVGAGSGGGGGGGGSGIGGAIFVDSGLTFTLQALSGIPTTFNTSNCTTQAGTEGSGSPGASPASPGTALGNSIFLRENSSLTLVALNTNDILTLGDGVSFIDDTSFGKGGTNVRVRGNGTVIYNGTTNYGGSITINNANFKVNGVINQAAISVCRDRSFSLQRGTLSGSGTLTGSVFVNSGTISPDNGETLTLGSLTLSAANPISDTLGSLVHIEIDAGGTSLVAVNNAATLAGVLEMAVDPAATTGPYTILTSSGITGTFNSITFTGATPQYSLSYLPMGAPTFVQFDFQGFSSSIATDGLSGNALRIANYLNENAPTSTLDLLNDLSEPTLAAALNSISPARNSFSTFIEAETAFSVSQVVSDRMDQMRFSQSDPTRAPFFNRLVADGGATPCFPKLREQETWASWMGGFVEYAKVGASLQNPAFHFLADGILVGLDYYGDCEEFMGAAVGYVHNHFTDESGMGSGHINSYCASLYGNVWFHNVYFSPSAWGIFNHSSQQRPMAFPGFSETASARISSWQFVPQFELGYVKHFSCVEVIPFTAFNWAISWQNGYTEQGGSPFNIEQDAHDSSMLRGELGLKFWEKWELSCGAFSLKEKVSYVCNKPFGTGTINAAFVGLPNSFSVVAVQQTLNLATVGLDLLFTLGRERTFDIQLSYEGEFGSSYWSNEGMLTFIKHF